MKAIAIVIGLAWHSVGATDAIPLAQATIACKSEGAAIVMFELLGGRISPRTLKKYCKLFKRGQMVTVVRTNDVLCIRGNGDEDCYWATDIPAER